MAKVTVKNGKSNKATPSLPNPASRPTPTPLTGGEPVLSKALMEALKEEKKKNLDLKKAQGKVAGLLVGNSKNRYSKALEKMVEASFVADLTPQECDARLESAFLYSRAAAKQGTASSLAMLEAEENSTDEE